MKENFKILEGDFIENQWVKVDINGVEIIRKVHWSSEAHDLFVWYQRMMYFFSEFE